jgi:hypothetical protein
MMNNGVDLERNVRTGMIWMSFEELFKLFCKCANFMPKDPQKMLFFEFFRNAGKY